jgi:DNA helicase-2/ATP-dependent DNA helicase PcrA
VVVGVIALTSEQQAAVSFENDLLLSACPGSGKTRVILAKLLRLADQVVATPRFIGCITYTNAAVDEIEFRLRTYASTASAEKCEIATIHSFCLQFILKPYCWLIPEIPTGFKVLTREAREFEQIVRSVEDAFGRAANSRTYDEYDSLSIDANGQPTGEGFTSGIVTEESASLYWETVRTRGYLDFSMILSYSLRILRQHEFVGSGLAARFQWLLIDEFQDTTDIQLEIFRELHHHLESTFFMVGDKNQSIMSFAGARPDLADEFADAIEADCGLALTGNFRSAPQIVAVADHLIHTEPPMHPAGAASNLVGLVEYVHVGSAVEAVTDYFVPLLEEHGIELGKAAVLAPWWTHLVPIARALRDFDVPVFGPGARPYKRRRLMVGLAEQLGASAECETYAGLPGVERAIFRLVTEMTGETRFDVFTYTGRRTALGLVYHAKNLAVEYPGGVDWLRNMAEATGEYLHVEGWLPASAKQMLIQSAEDMIDDMQSAKVDLPNLLISDLGLFANPEQALKLITLHNSKGREFDAVAMICMNRGHLPHFTAQSDGEYEEARRLFYVGITRARKVLLIASDQSHWKNTPCPFIAEAGLA